MKFINLIGVSDVFLEGPDMSVTLAQSTSTLDGKKGFFFFKIRQGLQDFIIQPKGGTLMMCHP